MGSDLFPHRRGIRVPGFTAMIAGPVETTTLRPQGADVIEIEALREHGLVA